MARTLFCLLVSMTVGAALLDWFEPSRSAAHASPTDLIAETVQQPWHAVQVEPCPADDTSAATKSHFIVDRAGELSITANWDAQRALGPHGVVRVAVAASPRSNQVTPAQWGATLQLIERLCDVCGIARQHIRVDDMIALPPLPERTDAADRPTPRKSRPVP